MKLTRTQLQEIIKEELSSALNEDPKSRFTTGAKLGSDEWTKQFNAALKAMVAVLTRAPDPASQKKANIIKSVMKKTIVGAFPAAGTLFAPEKPVTAKTFTAPPPETDPLRDE